MTLDKPHEAVSLWTKFLDFHNHMFQKMDGTHRSLFETIVRPALKQLPSAAYE
jgi:hypothetical protein